MARWLLLAALAGCEDRTCIHTHAEHQPGYTRIRYDESVTRDRRGRVISRTTIPIPVYVPPRDMNVCDEWMVCAKDSSGQRMCHRE